MFKDRCPLSGVDGWVLYDPESKHIGDMLIHSGYITPMWERDRAAWIAKADEHAAECKMMGIHSYEDDPEWADPRQCTHWIICVIHPAMFFEDNKDLHTPEVWDTATYWDVHVLPAMYGPDGQLYYWHNEDVPMYWWQATYVGPQARDVADALCDLARADEFVANAFTTWERVWSQDYSEWYKKANQQEHEGA